MLPFRILIPITLATMAGIAATDLYLPAIPDMPNLLGGTAVDAQTSLAVFIFTLAGGQLVFGSLGDMYDRRLILILAMAAFGAVTVACAYVETMDGLIAMRAVQGFFASAAPALAPAILKSTGDETQVVKMISVISSVEALMPAFAPIVGAWMVITWGWESTFLVTGVFAVIAMMGLWATKLPQVERQKSQAFSGYLKLFRNKPYQGYALSHAFAFTGLIAFVLSLPYVIVTEWERSINAFIGLQIVMVSVFIIGANTSAKVMARLGANRTVVLGGWMQFTGALGLMGLALIPDMRNVWPIAVVMVPFAVGLGWRAGPGFSKALDQAPDQGGQAGGLMTCMALGFTAIATQAVAPLLPYGLLALAVLNVCLTALAMILLRWAVPFHARAVLGPKPS